jgi:anaerobic selenocysteine-containing dehydrogenase
MNRRTPPIERSTPRPGVSRRAVIGSAPAFVGGSLLAGAQSVFAQRGDTIKIGAARAMTGAVASSFTPLYVSVKIATEDFCATPQATAFPYVLVCSRANNAMNSIGTNLPGLLKGKPYNPLFMHQSDMSSQGMQDADVPAIASRYDTILGIVEANATLRHGVVAMPHGFGAQGENAERNPFLAVSNVILLMHVDEYDAVSGIPCMSALPVSVVPHRVAAAA